MKKFLLAISILFLSVILLNSCKLGTSPTEKATNTSGTVTVTGQVVDSTSGENIKGAIVRLTYNTEEVGLETDDEGKFTAEFDITENTSLSIEISKPDYKRYYATEFLIAGTTRDFGQITLAKTDNAIKPSVGPASIVLIGQSAESIGVKESGSVETALITFEVQDSSGLPIDFDHRVDVVFSLGGAPGGGEYVFPTSVKTNAFGQVSTALTSGTISGVVQITAKLNDNGNVIKSKPVPITIHGGLPDLAHFSIAPVYSNIPGLSLFGFEDEITAFVGDKYSNPVAVGSAVYFNSTGGIIEGSILTNDLGRGTVILTTANPIPSDPNLGPGFATITATTADENLNVISTDIKILFSGGPEDMSISPTTFDIPNLGTQFFTYHVSDRNGNPLSSGSNFNVTVDGDAVDARGDVSIILPDTQSKFWTNFSFSVTDQDSTDLGSNPRSVIISIEASTTLGVTTSNKLSISGVIH